MIKNLQVLRGMAALMIFAHHFFGFKSKITLPFGDSAVAIFMVLSGFVLAYTFIRPGIGSKESTSFPQFILKRLIRIYPLYFLGQVIMFALLNFDLSGSEALYNLLMIQNWTLQPRIFWAGNQPLWFISALMFSYVLFLPTLSLFTGKRLIMICSMALLLTAYFFCVKIIPDNMVYEIIYIFPPMQFPAFVLGMFGGILFNKTGEIKSGLLADSLILISFGILIIQMFYSDRVSERYALSSYWWTVTFGLILILALTDNSQSILTSIFHRPALIKFGDMSYAFFVFHSPFLKVWRDVTESLNFQLHIELDFILSAAILTCISYGIHRLIEKPVTKFLDSRLLRPGHK